MSTTDTVNPTTTLAPPVLVAKPGEIVFWFARNASAGIPAMVQGVNAGVANLAVFFPYGIQMQSLVRHRNDPVANSNTVERYGFWDAQ